MRRGQIAAAPLVAALWLCAAPATAAPAATIETAAAIRSAIAAELQPRLDNIRNATVDIGAIDARLHLPSCPVLEVGLSAPTGAAMTAKVDCPSPNWTIYVPIRLHAWSEAIVAATNLAPNTTLTADQLSRGRVDMFAAAGGVVTEPARAEGRILRVGVIAGSPILASFLQLPLVVRRGDKLLLTLSDGAMEIRNSVVAMEDGHSGDSISVKNPESGKTIRATVTGEGNAEIKF